MPQCNPEDYLDIGDVELLGPSAIRLQGSAPQPAEEVLPTNAFQIQQQLFDAERRGDTAAIQKLSLALDDATLSAPPELSTQDSNTIEQFFKTGEQTPALMETLKGMSEAELVATYEAYSGQKFVYPEGYQRSEDKQQEDTPEVEEAPTGDFKDSDFNKSLVNQLGADETDELYGIINDGAGDDVLQAFFESAQGDGEYADSVIGWARIVKASGAAPTAGLEASAIDESTAQKIVGASEYGEEILQLNQKVLSGQMSKAELFQEVMGNPALMAEAVKLRNSNLLQF